MQEGVVQFQQNVGCLLILWSNCLEGEIFPLTRSLAVLIKFNRNRDFGPVHLMYVVCICKLKHI